MDSSRLSFKRFISPAALIIVSTLLMSTTVMAQGYPERPITIIVPFSAGGGVDVMARLLAEKLRSTLNQNIVVENRPGASGMLGAQYVSKAAPDGYTVLLGSAGETAINPFVYQARMTYQPERDLTPVALVSRVPNVLIAGPSLKVYSLAQVVAMAKTNPGKLSYASSGVGNPQHLNGALLETLGAISMMHVPYKGASGQLADVTGGNVDLTFVSYAAALPYLQSGKVRALAVSSKKRAAFAPDIPSISETPGLENYGLVNWFGVFAPSKTPAAVVDKLNSAVATVLNDKEFAQRLADQGGEVDVMTAAAFKAFITEESKQYKTIVDTSGIKAE